MVGFMNADEFLATRAEGLPVTDRTLCGVINNDTLLATEAHGITRISLLSRIFSSGSFRVFPWQDVYPSQEIAEAIRSCGEYKIRELLFRLQIKLAQQVVHGRATDTEQVGGLRDLAADVVECADGCLAVGTVTYLAQVKGRQLFR